MIKFLHLKRALIFLFFLTFSTVIGQVYGSFPYTETFTSAVKPSQVSLFLPQTGVNSVSFASNGVVLTPALNNKFGGFYINNKQFSSINGVNIEFEYGMYGGGGGGDGICLYLFDATIPIPVIGSIGGSLGYTYRRTTSSAGVRQTGLTGAYLGIGLDNTGNFKRSVYVSNERISGIANTLFTVGSSQVTLRGAKGDVISTTAGLGDGFTGYPVLKTQSTLAGVVGGAELDSSTGTFTLLPGLSTNSFSLGTSVFTTDPNNINYRKAYISLRPNSLGGFNVTVKIRHGLITSTIIDNYWYKTSVTYTENTNPVITDFDNSIQRGANTVRTISAKVPDAIRIGFGASTGQLNNIHLIRNLVIMLPYSAVSKDDSFAYCPNESDGTVFPLTNDIAYSGLIADSPVASASNVDLTSFNFLDGNGVSMGHTYSVLGQGTWTYNSTTGAVKFAPEAGYKGVSSVKYDVKGATSPYNDNGYRSLPATITANPFFSSSIIRQPINKTVNSGNNISFNVVANGGSVITKYQWQVSIDAGSNWSNLINGGVYFNTTTNTLNLVDTPRRLNGNLYRVIITESNFTCAATISDVALLSVHETDLSVHKTVNKSAAVVGTDVTFTISAKNNGPSDATGVIVNDILPSGYALVSASPSIGKWEAPNWVVGNLTNDISADLTIIAKVKPAGSYANTAIITSNETDPIPENNTSTVVVASIDALPDTNVVTVNGASGGDSGINVYANDILNGKPIKASDLVLTFVPKGPLTVNADGTVHVAPNTASGVYTINYTICEVLNPDNCDTATITVNVGVPVIDAIPDTNVIAVNGASGGDSGINVYANDILNEKSVKASDVVLTFVPKGPLTVNADGTVLVAPNTASGVYTINYTICEVLNPDNCDTATITVNVGVPVIDAIRDTNVVAVNGASGGDSGINVYANDILNGKPVKASDVVLTSVPKGPLTVNADATVHVAPNTASGVYSINYTICEVLNPENCDIATVTVSVVVPVIDALPDANVVAVNGASGGDSGINVYANDILNGKPVKVSDVVLSSVPKGPLTVNADGTVHVAPNTASGVYSINYTICEVLNPENCDTAAVTVSVLCIFNVACPTFSATTVECYEKLPASGTLTISQFEALGNGNGLISDSSCGVVEIIASNGVYNGCNAMVTRTYTVTQYADSNNNNVRDLAENVILKQFICTQDILIHDVSAPIFVEKFPTNLTVECLEIPIAPVLTATDNCSSVTIDFAESVSSVSTEGFYSILRAWTASDDCGNYTTATQTLNVKVPNYFRKIRIKEQCNIDMGLVVDLRDVIKGQFRDINFGKGSFTDISNSRALENSTGVFKPLNLAEGNYIVKYENNDAHCPGIIEITIPVSASLSCKNENCIEIIFHNAVSPNGDGINDEFIIENVLNGCYKNNTVEIYNRWGIKVFDAVNYDNSNNTFKGYSDGRSTRKNSSVLPSGTYFYIFKYKNIQGGSSSKTGWLYLSGTN